MKLCTIYLTCPSGGIAGFDTDKGSACSPTERGSKATGNGTTSPTRAKGLLPWQTEPHTTSLEPFRDSVPSYIELRRHYSDGVPKESSNLTKTNGVHGSEVNCSLPQLCLDSF